MKKLFVLLALSMFLTGYGALTGEEIGRLKINPVSADGNLIA